MIIHPITAVSALVVCASALLPSITYAGNGARQAATIHRAVASYDRFFATNPVGIGKVRESGNLAGAGFVAGWFEYDIDVPERGWYQLLVDGIAADVEFLFDPDGQGLTSPGLLLVGSGRASQPNKIGNVWLSKGKHRLRIQRYFWTGFQNLTGFELKRSDGTLANSVQVAPAGDEHIYALGRCPDLEIVSGGLAAPGRLGIRESDTLSDATLRWHAVDIPAGSDLWRQKLALPCTSDGFRTLWFADGNRALRNEELRAIDYEVIDTRAPARLPSIRPPGKVIDIDCATRAPDYSGGQTQIVRPGFGDYRESGSVGLTRYQRAPEVARKVLPKPSWFAYTLEGLAPQQRYRVEVDYPDDQMRTFAIAMREERPLQYPVAIGVDTGGEYPLSHGTQTQSMVVWPRNGASPRLTFVTAHDGQRAACTRIRVYRAEAPEPLAADSEGTRRFLLWYEEGDNYASLFGPDDVGPRGPRTAVERWAEAVTAVGGSTLMPTVSVYSFNLYPSRYNVSFSRPGDTRLRRILLTAEKYHLKVVPELGARADELMFGRTDGVSVPGNLAKSRDGKTNFLAGDGKTRIFPPHYNALAPENQDWYVAMIGELADNYQDSPALEGISLRYMAWANPALNNLVNLDWGYDDATVARYKKETGSAVPLGRADDQKRFAARHVWLTGQERQAWIDWRCKQIADLITRIRDRVRMARPGLKLYLNVFGAQGVYAGSLGDAGSPSLVSKLRESGIDPALLIKIEGVVLLNSAYSYGRREIDGDWRGYRDMLLDPASLNALRKAGDGGHFLSSSQYLEATDVIVPPEALGFPANTKKTWMGAAMNPAGRHALERYAVELAESDALTLGDGGNSYVFAPATLLREFMANFRRLPARRFEDRPEAVDPVAVRSLAAADAYYFYAVNRERYPVAVDIALDKAADVASLADGKAAPIDNGHLRLTLRPYELIAFKAAAATRIRAVATRVPDGERERVARQIAAVERLAGSSLVQTLVRRGPTEEEHALLSNVSRAAREALEHGRLWRARTLLEHSALLAIYKRTGCYPPELRHGDRGAESCPE